MPKIRKLQRKKKFRVNVNRKRLRNKLRKLPTIECKQIKEAWGERCSVANNLRHMGLAYDANKAVEIPNLKKDLLKVVKDGEEVEDSDAEDTKKFVPKKGYVAQSLEEEAKWPRARLFRLPKNEVQFATYMMDKYGDDYKAMMKDRKNYYQLTWRQIRSKIERFKGIPEQYAEYLVQKGEIVLDDPTPLKKIKPPILEEPVEKKSNSKKLSRRKRKKSNILESVMQEEAEDDIIDFDVKKTVDDIEEDDTKNIQSGNEKKLKLFSDNEDDDDSDDQDSNSDDDDNDDEDLNDSNDSDDSSENEDQADEEIKIIKSKTPSKLKKHKITIQKTKNKASSDLKKRKVTNQKTKRLR